MRFFRLKKLVSSKDANRRNSCPLPLTCTKLPLSEGKKEHWPRLDNKRNPFFRNALTHYRAIIKQTPLALEAIEGVLSLGVQSSELIGSVGGRIPAPVLRKYPW